MQKLMKEYLNEWKRRQKRRRRIAIAVVLLIVIVAGTVTSGLTRSGVAMTEDEKCGIQEHQHDETCYEDVLICGQEEGKQESQAVSEGHQHTDECYAQENVLDCGLEESEGHEHTDGCYESEDVLTCGLAEDEEHQHTGDCYESEDTMICSQQESGGHTHTEGCYRTETVLQCDLEESEASQHTKKNTVHTHTEECYESQIICGLEEHTHIEACRIDRTADVEDASKWDAMYASVEWADSWNEDLVTAAQMQLGYKESADNYELADDGSHKGYTRFGDFSGDAYADWDAAFVNFCMYYAGLMDSGMFPGLIDTYEWYEEFTDPDNGNGDYLVSPDEHTPEAGDIIFLQGEDEDARMGIVSSYDEEENEITVIEGNSNDEVKENTYEVNNGDIAAYVEITGLEEAYKEPEKEALVLRYEDDDVEILVTAKDEGAIPEGVELKVVPIVKGNEETEKQYNAIEEQLWEKVQQDAAKEEKEYLIAGFLAYDISFIDADGVETEPVGNVNVSMRYKKAALPEEVLEDDENLAVTVMHLEEDESGSVKKVVNMAESEQLKGMTTTEKQEVQNVEFETDSFSAVTVVWLTGNDGMSVAAYDVVAHADVDMGVPEHHKYIREKHTTDDGTDAYTLSLDVKGKIIPKTIDIMLIIDNSGSMSTSRYKNVNTAVQNMISECAKILPEEGVNINVGIVEFSDGYPGTCSATDGRIYAYGEHRNNWKFGTNNNLWLPNKVEYDTAYKLNTTRTAMETVKDARQVQQFIDIKNLKYTLDDFGLGTNWQAGFKEAEKMLQTRKSLNNDTYVVFITDGLPTARYYAGTDGTTQGTITESCYIGTNLAKQNNPNYQYALTEWKNSECLRSATKAYVVDAADDYKASGTPGDCQERCDAFAAAIGAGKSLNGSGSALSTTITNIIKEIKIPAYTNVSITDTLSENVEFAFTNPASDASKKNNFKVYQYNADGVSGGKKLTYDVDYTLTVDAPNKSFTVNLLQGKALKNNYVYRVQVDVIPSQKAITSYLAGSLAVDSAGPDTGDKGTDGPGTVSPETSSNKSGFYSNENSKTYLSYTANNTPQPNSPYEKPVVQVKKVKRSVVKTWQGEQAKSIKVALTAMIKDNSGQLVARNDLQYIQTLLDQEKNKLTLTADANGQWTGEWPEVLPKYHYYYDASGDAKHTRIYYIVKEVQILNEQGKDVTAKYEMEIPTNEEQAATDDATPIGINNKRKMTLTLIKTDALTSSKRLQGAEFTLKNTQTNEVYTGTSDANGRITFDQFPSGMTTPQTYILTETKAPQDYQIMPQPIEIILPYNGTTPVDNPSSNPEIGIKVSSLAGTFAEPAGQTDYYEIELTVENSLFYRLPSTGGLGVYWYTFGGVLLMMGAALIIYKNKRKEVLGS